MLWLHASTTDVQMGGSGSGRQHMQLVLRSLGSNKVSKVCAARSFCSNNYKLWSLETFSLQCVFFFSPRKAWLLISSHESKLFFTLESCDFSVRGCVIGKGKKKGGSWRGGRKEATAFDVRNPLLLMLFLLIKHPSQYFGRGTKQKHMRKKV